MVALVQEADANTIRRGSSDDPGSFGVEFESRPIDYRITIEGYEMELVQVEGRRPRVRPTEKLRTYPDVPYLADWTPTRTVPRPNAYLITAQDPEIIDKLLQHGIAVDRLTEPTTLSVEQFTVTEASGAGRLNQGHYNTSVAGDYETVELEFPAGTLVVSTAQALGNLVVSLLEIESDDGMVYWNFFDRYLATQWSSAPHVYPVFKIMEPVRLPVEPFGR